MKGCPVCLNGTSHLPAVWLGSWWTPVFFRGWTADMCDAGSGQTRTSLQMNPQSTGQTRSQMSSQTLGNPGHFLDEERQSKVNGIKQNTASQGERARRLLTRTESTPLTCRSWLMGHWDLLTKDEEPSNCFTFVRNTCAGFWLVTVTKGNIGLNSDQTFTISNVLIEVLSKIVKNNNIVEYYYNFK